MSPGFGGPVRQLFCHPPPRVVSPRLPPPSQSIKTIPSSRIPLFFWLLLPEWTQYMVGLLSACRQISFFLYLSAVGPEKVWHVHSLDSHDWDSFLTWWVGAGSEGEDALELTRSSNCSSFLSSATIRSTTTCESAPSPFHHARTAHNPMQDRPHSC